MRENHLPHTARMEDCQGLKKSVIFLRIRHRMNPQDTDGICWDIIAIRRNQDTDKPSTCLESV